MSFERLLDAECLFFGVLYGRLGRRPSVTRQMLGSYGRLGPSSCITRHILGRFRDNEHFFSVCFMVVLSRRPAKPGKFLEDFHDSYECFFAICFIVVLGRRPAKAGKFLEDFHGNSERFLAHGVSGIYRPCASIYRKILHL